MRSGSVSVLKVLTRIHDELFCPRSIPLQTTSKPKAIRESSQRVRFSIGIVQSWGSQTAHSSATGCRGMFLQTRSCFQLHQSLRPLEIFSPSGFARYHDNSFSGVWNIMNQFIIRNCSEMLKVNRLPVTIRANGGPNACRFSSSEPAH